MVLDLYWSHIGMVLLFIIVQPGMRRGDDRSPVARARVIVLCIVVVVLDLYWSHIGMVLLFIIAQPGMRRGDDRSSVARRHGNSMLK